jgi:hypothetical protein
LKWFATSVINKDALFNADKIIKITKSECGDVIQILAWYDNDIENCEVLREFDSDKAVAADVFFSKMCVWLNNCDCQKNKEL